MNNASTMSRNELRREIVNMVVGGQNGHIPSAFSIVDIVEALYDKHLNVRANEPDWPDRDYFLLSKGHGCIALYAVLHQHGFLTDADLELFCKKGGILGRKIEPVVVDPASNWPLFAEKARELISREQVDVIFGCWTSVSRKSVLPVIEELNGLLFYPVQYEGEESSKNVFYTGAAPNQQAIPAVNYMRDELGVDRWFLAGTDYVYPRTTNKILEAYLTKIGVDESDIKISFTPFGHNDWQGIVSEIKKYGSMGIKTAVVSTINGDANVPFYKELGNQGISAEDIPVVAFSVGEEELSGLDTRPLVGHLAAWNYFQSVDSEENKNFIEKWKMYIKDEDRVTNDPMEATYIGFKMWVQAVEKANSTDVDAVEQAMLGLTTPNLTGGIAVMNTNHHLSKPVLIGEIQADGQIETVWETHGTVIGDAWSDFLPASKDLIADWTKPVSCGNYNTKTAKCSGQNF